MLFRRFALVTTCITLAAIGLSNLIASTTQNRANGFSVEQRELQWQEHDKKVKCKSNAQTCATLVIAAPSSRLA